MRLSNYFLANAADLVSTLSYSLDFQNQYVHTERTNQFLSRDRVRITQSPVKERKVSRTEKLVLPADSCNECFKQVLSLEMPGNWSTNQVME